MISIAAAIMVLTITTTLQHLLAAVSLNSVEDAVDEALLRVGSLRSGSSAGPGGALKWSMSIVLLSKSCNTGRRAACSEVVLISSD